MVLFADDISSKGIAATMRAMDNPWLNVPLSDHENHMSAGFTVIDPASLRATIEVRGFHIVRESRRALPAGQAFWMGIFARAC